ncbi:LamG-like jellyroll fold domain-containing protein, partial [Candidatus Sororendozoicomonas aggregata]|uniref:LamG-like jellyroll fold domain-containing protein n=1 Tax=Candidatus Sororendozoicomonas aggregata TaxID=3073239 RepID=UPI002ED5AA06
TQAHGPVAFGGNAASSRDHANTQVVVLENGTLVTGYESAGTWYIQRWSASGTAEGAPIAVGSDDVIPGSDLQLTAVGDDVLTTFVAADDDGTGIYSQLYGDDGAVLTDPMLINDTSAGDQSMPAVTALSDGTVKIVWSSDHSGNDDVYSKTLALGHEVVENAKVGTLVGKVQATDAEGEALTYSLVDDAGGRFAIDPLTGVITVARAVDYEAAASHALIVRAADALGESTEQTIVVHIENVNEAPVSEDGAQSVGAGQPYALSVDDFNIQDPDNDDTHTITLTGINGEGSLFRGPLPELMLDFEDAGALGADLAGVSVATLHGTQAASDPNRGGIVNFDSQGDVIALDQPLALGNSWTISTGFKGLGSGNWKSLSRSSEGFQVIVNSNGELGSYVGGSFYSSGFDLSSHPAVTAGEWVDLVAVGENGQTTFYVNGQSVGSVNQQVGGNLSLIGNNGVNGSERFAENLADFRLFDRALEPSEFDGGTKINLFREPQPELMLDFEDAGAMGANQAGVSVATLHGTQSASDPDRGGVVEFDNQGDAITLDQPLALGNSWTISTAFKGLGSGTWKSLSRGSDGFQVIVNNDGMLGSYANGTFHSSGFDLSSHPAVTAGDWVDLVAVGENGQTTFYVDGQFVGSVSQQIGGNLSTIGNNAANGSERFAENLADFRVFDQALVPSEFYGTKFDLFREPEPELMLDFEDAGAMGANQAGVSVATLHGTQSASDPDRGGVVEFDNQGDAITLDQPLALGNSWTISTAFKGLGSSGILSRSSDGFQVVVNNDGELGSFVGGSFYSSGFDLSSHPAVTAGDWVDLVAVGENGQTTFYVNGQSVGSVSQQVGGNLSTIGNSAANGSERFAESLADFKVFDRALAPGEISSRNEMSLEESFTAEEVAELVFVPNENANSGANSIEYQVTDGQGVKTSSHTLSINVAEQISGTANDDQLQGTSGIDELIGLDGNDELTGGAGNDLLIGGAGDDILIGGDGQDEYIWHLGDDVTADPNVMAVDRIRDFQTGVGGDVLNIKDLLVDESEHNIGDYLELNFKDGNTEIDVKPTGSGASTQKIILDDVDLSSLGSEADVLNKLLNDGNLNIDH